MYVAVVYRPKPSLAPHHRHRASMSMMESTECKAETKIRVYGPSRACALSSLSVSLFLWSLYVNFNSSRGRASPTKKQLPLTSRLWLSESIVRASSYRWNQPQGHRPAPPTSQREQCTPPATATMYICALFCDGYICRPLV